MACLTPKSKNVSLLDIIWSQLTHFDIRQIKKSGFSQSKKIVMNPIKSYEIWLDCGCHGKSKIPSQCLINPRAQVDYSMRRVKPPQANQPAYY